jgi:hypothetical protein
VSCTLIFALGTKNGTSVCKGHEEPVTLYGFDGITFTERYTLMKHFM